MKRAGLDQAIFTDAECLFLKPVSSESFPRRRRWCGGVLLATRRTKRRWYGGVVLIAYWITRLHLRWKAFHLSNCSSQSETWLLERTYHAQLRNGGDLSVPDLTRAMKQLINFDVPLSTQSTKSNLPERLPPRKSTNFYVPLSAWREVSQEEASASSRQRIPILLYGEHSWEHPQGAEDPWGLNKNMRVIIFGNAKEQPEALSGTDSAVCYLDPQRGTFANSVWKAWFPSDTAMLLEGDDDSAITFFAPCVQFP